jgi:hypothetical protein
MDGSIHWRSDRVKAGRTHCLSIGPHRTVAAMSILWDEAREILARPSRGRAAIEEPTR